MSTTIVSTPLKWDVFVIKRQGLSRDLPPGKEQWMWVPTSATLIYGQRDAVLVDALLTVEQAQALVEWVAASGKNLTTIYITHGHGDHFFGIGALQQRFPNARAVATPDVVKVMRQQASPEYVANFWRARLPGQIPERLVIANEIKGNITSTLSSQTRRVGASGSPRSTQSNRSIRAWLSPDIRNPRRTTVPESSKRPGSTFVISTG